MTAPSPKPTEIAKPMPRIELLRGRITHYPRCIDDDGLVDYLPDNYTGRVALVPCGACNGWGGDHEQPVCLSCNGKGYYFTLPFDNCEICRGASLGVPGNENRIPSSKDPRGYIVACDYCSSRSVPECAPALAPFEKLADLQGIVTQIHRLRTDGFVNHGSYADKELEAIETRLSAVVEEVRGK